MCIRDSTRVEAGGRPAEISSALFGSVRLQTAGRCRSVFRPPVRSSALMGCLVVGAGVGYWGGGEGSSHCGPADGQGLGSLGESGPGLSEPCLLYTSPSP